MRSRPPGQHHEWCTSWRTTDQQPGHPNHGVSRQQESGRQEAPDSLTVVGVADGSDRGRDAGVGEVVGEAD